MKIVVTGGAGLMALPALIYILEQSDVTEVIVADKDKSRIEERLALLNDSRAVGKEVDLMDVNETAKLFEGAKCVFNAALLTTCKTATEAAAKAGVNYIDLGSPFFKEQLVYREEFEKKGIVAVLGLGTAPGMSGIMPAYVVDRLDSVDTIEIQDVCANLTPHDEHSRALYWAYSIDGIIDEFTAMAPVLENGEIKHYPPRSFPEIVNFKPPVGPSSISITDHPEVITFAESFKDKGIKNVTWKIGFEPEFESKLQFLYKLGLLQTEPISVNGTMISPREVLMTLLNNQPPETKKLPDFRGHMIVVVKGEEAGEKVKYTVTEYATSALTERMQKKGCFSSYRTGLYAGIGTIMCARGEITKKGIYYSETGIPAEAFLKEAARIGIDVGISREFSL